MKVYLNGSNVIVDTGIGQPAIIASTYTDYEIMPPAGQETILIKDLANDVFYSALFSNIENEAGATIGNLDQVQAYLDGFIGSANAGQGGGAAGGAIESWVYKHSSYLPASRLTLQASGFTETVISNNVNLLHKTAATDAHDGSKFVFAEDDVVQVRVNMKIDGNVNNNLVRVKLRSKDGNYAIRQSHEDTNVQQFGQDISFDFAPFNTNAGTAANGFDLTVSEFTSTADAFIYNILITVQKIGTKV